MVILDEIKKLNPTWFKRAIGANVNRNIITLPFNTPKGKREGSFYVTADGIMAFIHKTRELCYFYDRGSKK